MFVVFFRLMERKLKFKKLCFMGFCEKVVDKSINYRIG